MISLEYLLAGTKVGPRTAIGLNGAFAESVYV